MFAVGNDLYWLLAALVAAVLLTAGIAATLGRWLARRHRQLALPISGLAVPMLPVLTTVMLNTLDGEVPGDGHGMALAGALFVAALAAPFTLLVSFLLLRRL